MTDATEQATAPAETSAEDKFFGVTTTIDTSPEKSPEKAAAEPAIEIETDEPKPVASTPPKTEAGASDEDMENYSEKVQRRINKMTWEKNEERRQRESAESIRDEAVRVAQTLYHQNQENQNIIANGEAYLLDQVKTKAHLALEKSRADYRKANEEGDTDALLNAQESLMYAQSEAQGVMDYDADYQQRVWQAQHQPPPQPQQYRPPTPQVRPPSQQSSAWADRNRWFGDAKHKDMTALAYGIHERLIRDEGYAPDTDEYFQKIDSEMQARFPDFFTDEPAQGTPHRRTTAVAPASRNNGARPRKVKLTPSQVALAKKLGITPEQYANELTRGM